MFAVHVGLVSGHALLSDWLFLIGAVLFILSALVAVLGRPDPSKGAFLPVGLALVAVAWLVL